MSPIITKRAPRRQQEGYAMLMIFLLAATIAISFYAVMPRVAFESQRDREQLLVDRGEQYKRGIQLFYRKFRRYPVKMEDLENTQNIRFLRQRYADPMTGKNEWRLIHVGPGGQFTDSLTQKNNLNKKQDPGSVNTFIAEFKSVPDPNAGNDQVSPALRKRPSDMLPTPGINGGDGTPPDPNGNGNEIVALPDPNNPDPDPNANAGVFAPGGAMPNNGFPTGDPTNPNPTGYIPGGEMPLAMQQQLQQQMQQNGQAPPTFVNGAGGSVGVPNQTTQTYYPPTTPLTGPAAIQRLLTSPRPGGPPAGIFNPSGRPMNDFGFEDGNGNTIPSPSNPQPVFPAANQNPAFGGANQGNSLQGGASPFGGAQANTVNQSGQSGNFAAGSFAGVASTLERRGIKRYAERSKYNEWEFIYDFGKDAAKASGLAVNTNGANTNSATQNSFGNTGFGAGSAGSTAGSTGAGSGNSTGSTSPGSTGPGSPPN